MEEEEDSQDGTFRTDQVLPFPWIYPEPEEVQPSKANANVASKTRNYHSKFTGKCGKTQCPKDKTSPKGTQKWKKRDIVVSPGLITWRVVDQRLGLNFSGFSATGSLEHLYNDDANRDIDDEISNHVNNDDDDDNEDRLFDDDYMANFWSHEKKDDENDDDDGMSFCDVGFMMDQTEEDEDWCLLGEI